MGRLRPRLASLVLLANGVGCVVVPAQPPPREPTALRLPKGAQLVRDSSCPNGTDRLIEHPKGGNEVRTCVERTPGPRGQPVRHGHYVVFAPEGRRVIEGEYRHERQHGLWRSWWPNGQVNRETLYQDGLTAREASWYESGARHELRDGTAQTVWYPDGTKSQQTQMLADGLRSLSSWYPNGKPSRQEYQRAGKADGVKTEWFENGHKHEEAEYRDGILHGASVKWFENGQKMEEALYRDGKLVSWTGWSSSGRELVGSSCGEDADCTVGTKNQCWRCVPPYEPVTRYEMARRLLHPQPPPSGCPEGPFPCPPPGPPPLAACRTSQCVLAPAAPPVR